MSEQLAFQKGLRQGGAVEGQEPLGGAGAVVIDGAGHQLLAGAAFSHDQRGDVLRGDAADGLKDLAHGGAAADDVVAVGTGSVVGGEFDADLHQAADFEGPFDQVPSAWGGRAA